MQTLSQHILEKLRLSKTPIKNEEVLVLEPIYVAPTESGYDLSLFLTGLDNLSKDYNCNDILISADIDNEEEYFTIYNKRGKTPDKFKLATDSSKHKLCEVVLYNSVLSNEPEIIKNAVPDIQSVLSNAVKQHRVKYCQYLFVGHFFIKLKYLYVWYSFDNNAIQMHFSNTSYKELLENNKFV